MIREATPADEAAVLSLVRAWPTHFVDAALPRVRRDFVSHRTFVDERAGKIVGAIVWRQVPTELEILWMAVQPDLARTGIGTALAAAVERQVSRQGRVFLKTASTDSTIVGTAFSGAAYGGTHAFWARLGYHIVYRIEDGWGPGNHCVIMEKKLQVHDERGR